jgi:hypothetical protein
MDKKFVVIIVAGLTLVAMVLFYISLPPTDVLISRILS